MKHYSEAPQEVAERVSALVAKYHPELVELKVRFDLLYVESDADGDGCLTHRGCPAYAVVRITSKKERAKGEGDAEIVIDRKRYENLPARTQNALLDHEIHHVVPKRSKKGGVLDSLGRPKLAIRKHDREFGWFDVIAERHGDWSIEVKQAKSIMAQAGQAYFGFMKDLTPVEVLALPAPAAGKEKPVRKQRPAA